MYEINLGLKIAVEEKLNFNYISFRKRENIFLDFFRANTFNNVFNYCEYRRLDLIDSE